MNEAASKIEADSVFVSSGLDEGFLCREEAKKPKNIRQAIPKMAANRRQSAGDEPWVHLKKTRSKMEVYASKKDAMSKLRDDGLC